MATHHGTFSGRSQYRLRLVINAGTQNIPANTTTVTWTLSIVKDSGTGSWSGGSSSYSLTVNGTNYTGNFTYDFRNYTSLTLRSGSTVVSHNTNGTKTVSFSASAAAAGALGNASLSSTLALPTIPRAPEPPTTPILSGVTPTGFTYSFTPGDQRGGPITGHEIQLATLADYSDATTYQVAVPERVFTGLPSATNYYLRARSENSLGVSGWGAETTQRLRLPAPSLTSWSQNAAGELVATWTAPSITTGQTGYRLQIARDATFTTAAQTFDLGAGALTHAVPGLVGGRRYWARIAARSTLGVETYSAALDTLLVHDSGDLDGWFRFGTPPAPIGYFTAEGLRRSTTGLHLESTASGAATITADTLGIARNLPTMTGRGYVFEVTLTATFTGSDPVQARTYRIGAGTEVSGPVVLGAEPVTVSVEFVAEDDTSLIYVVLAETLAIPGAQDEVERLLVSDIRVLELGTTFDQRLRSTVYESTLANHLDLACNSVGAIWYVDRENVTRFTPPGSALPVSHVFSDEREEGALEYIDVSAGYDTRALVNRLNVTNRGWNPDEDREANDTFIYQGNDSIARYGTYAENLPLNLYDAPPYDLTLGHRLDSILEANSEPQRLVTRVRWNAQQDVARVGQLEVGQRVRVRFNESDQDAQIVSLTHIILPERWIVTIDLNPLETPTHV